MEKENPVTQNNPLRIVFMGTPEFAVTILTKLVGSEHQVVAVVTAMDKPAGRGKKLKQSAVKIFAEAKGLTIFQPESLKDEKFIHELKSVDADLFVVVAFRMLPKNVWSMPKKGTINLHASLLPSLRGAAPINWAIMNGLKETGITTFFINELIDTGEIIDQQKVKIGENMNCGELHDLLMVQGAELIMETISKITLNTVQTRKQEDNSSSEAPKIFKEDCAINWRNSANVIHNQIRGLSPYPAAWCRLYNSKKGVHYQFKLYASTLSDEQTNPSQKRLAKGIHGILFPCGDGAIAIQELQVEGKSRMDYKAFLAGNDLSDWELA